MAATPQELAKFTRECFAPLGVVELDREVGRQTTPASWRAIVESLKNPVQQRIVADDRERTNVLVLAGSGSGKTRVLLHRIAWLIRVRRENARGILALAYNRHAAVDIRRRLAEMIGDDARGVTMLTCHALAMRLAGASFTGRSERPDDGTFNKDVKTFDQMALALHYHMFQLVVVANSGQYGGSNAYWPVKDAHVRQVFHTHRQPEASISFLEIEDIGAFSERHEVSGANAGDWKHPPAGLN